MVPLWTSLRFSMQGKFLTYSTMDWVEEFDNFNMF